LGEGGLIQAARGGEREQRDDFFHGRNDNSSAAPDKRFASLATPKIH
jgi:hypothetical protein